MVGLEVPQVRMRFGPAVYPGRDILSVLLALEAVALAVAQPQRQLPVPALSVEVMVVAALAARMRPAARLQLEKMAVPVSLFSFIHLLVQVLRCIWITAVSGQL
jgi:hypothetical protein